MSKDRKLRVWIDGQCLQTASRMRGIGRYVSELLRAIAKHHPEVELIISFNAAMAEEALLAREAVSEFISPENIHVWHGVATSGEAIEGFTPERRLSEIALTHHVNCIAPDVALSASPFEGAMDLAVPLLPDQAATFPSVSIFYDAIPYRFKETYLVTDGMREYYERRLGYYAEFSSNLCISGFSESELRSIHPEAPTTDISAGVSESLLVEGRSTNIKFSNLGDFALYVGGFDWRKNLDTVVKAYAHLAADIPSDFKLVIAGDAPQHLFEALRQKWKAAKLSEERLIWMEHVSDVELAALYRQSRLVLQPSLMEGFGLTALEAILIGAPVLAANAGPMPEIINDERFLFEPKSHTELAQKIGFIFKQPEEVKAAFENIRKQAKRFNWQNTSSSAVEVLNRLAEGHKAAKDIGQLRQQILQAVPKEPARDVVAKAMSLAEPVRSTKRLLIDATSTIRVDHKSGIQRVVKKICSAMADESSKRNPEHLFISCEDERGWFQTDGQTLSQPVRNEGNKVAITSDTLLMLDSSWEFYRLHSTYLLACRMRGGSVISCLYDTVPLYASAFCDPGMPIIFAEWFQSALAHSDGFVCISKAVADELYDILQALEFPRKMKIGYWQLGADFGSKTANALKSSRGERPMFLMVGTMEPRKGHRVILDAFEALWSQGYDADLVIVGKSGWGNAHLVDRIKGHSEFGNRLVWRDKVDDDELASLYVKCTALIAASFAEGFGLPIVEAGYLGKPVIASDIAVFREVAEGAPSAHFFAAGSSAEAANIIKQMIQAPAPQYSDRSVEWPNWKASAAQLDEILLSDTWYKTYAPSQSDSRYRTGAVGKTVMTSPLDASQRAYRIELIEGPYQAGNDSLKIVVAVENLSETIWSSRGAVDGSLGIRLGVKLISADGRQLDSDMPRTWIPLVHPPGQVIYLPVTIPQDELENGATSADIDLVQEGVAWFGSPLRVQLRGKSAVLN